MASDTGLVQGIQLNAALLGQFNARTDSEWIKGVAGNPADGAGGRSSNILLVKNATGAVVGVQGVRDWAEREALRRLDVGPLFAGEDGTAQYPCFHLVAVAVLAWCYPDSVALRRLLRAMLTWFALAAVRWRATQKERLSSVITVLGLGNRTQEHFFGPATLILADIFGWDVDGKWTPFTDPRSALDGNVERLKQAWMWPYFAWLRLPEAFRRQFREELLAVVNGGVPAPEVLSDIKLREPWTLILWTDGALLFNKQTGNCQSTACSAAVALRGRAEAEFLVADRDPDGPGPQRYRGGDEIGPVSAAITDMPCWGEPVASGMVWIEAADDMFDRRETLSTSLDGAGRVLRVLHWYGRNGGGFDVTSVWLDEELPEKPPEPMTQEERLTALEARVAALEARS